MSVTVRTEESSSKNSYGGPPKISINLPEISELTQTFKYWKDVELPIDILLLTVKDCEFLSCYYYIVDPFTSYCRGLGHVYFGSIGEDQDVKLKVALMRCSEGSKAPGGSLTVVKNAVTQLRPKAVFSVGHCSGMNQETTKLGDVVLSEKLTTYSYQKFTKDRMEFCGVTAPVSKDIADLIKCAGFGWNPPLEYPKERKVEVHRGEILSGSELVQAERRSGQLVKSFPGAIAIETEGEGVYSAAFDLKMEWVVVKGISGYADGSEVKESWKTFASVTAASLVVSILNECSIFDDWPHYKEDSIPIYIKARGKGGLIAYRRALEKGQTYDRRTKIVLIGQDRTGKTSLRRYLRGEAFDKDEASTDGIEMISPVKSAGKGAWRNPAALENTSALDHKCAEITKEILSNSTNRSDRAQPLTEVGNKTRGEPTIGQKATEERASHHLVRDPLLIRPSSEHSGTKDVKSEEKPDEIPKEVLSIIERGPEHSEGIWPVVWDFAGQAVYHAIHPIFLSPEAVYVLVSDLTKELCAPAQCRIRPHNRDEIEVNSPQVDDTNLDHMLRWLDLVHSLGRPESQKISGNDGDVLPPVVLVGTHADGVSDPCKEMESVKGTICSVALQATLNHISKESFFIDNTNPNREDDPQIVSLRVKILDLAKRMPHINKVIPMQWLRVEQKVDEMVSRDKPIYYVGKKCFKEDIAGGICQFDDPNDVEELLYFLQVRGRVIYQDLPENPDGLVVLDPQWLIKVLYEIVTVSPEWKNDPVFQKDFKVLGKKGLLSQKLLDRAFKYLGLEDIKNSLIRIMESFDVICNSENCKGEKYPFFVPCMLESPRKNTRATNMCNGPLPVFLTFNTNYVPSGLFCRLVVYFWKWASRLCGTRLPPSLFANAARFNVSKEYQLTVECHKTVIQLIIWTSRDSDVKEEKRICEELLSHLERCRTKLNVTCPWLRLVTMELFVKCQLCEPCPDKCCEGTSICMLHKKEGCSHFDCGHYIQLRSFGLSCEHSVYAVPDYPAEKLAPWVQALESIERKKQISGSTEHLVRTSLKRRNEEPSLCEAPACKERKTASQALPVKAGGPSDYELEALSRKLGDKWEEVGLRLGFDEADVNAFDEDNRKLRKKALRMLMAWKQKEGSKGTYIVLYKALCHEFVGCAKLAEEFCCDKIAENGSN